MTEGFGTRENRVDLRPPAAQISWDVFGGATTYIDTPLSVEISTKEILKNNPNRVALYIINNSVSLGYVAFSPELVSGKGIRLTANGGSLVMLIHEDGDAIKRSIYGISAGAGADWWAYETVICGPFRRRRT